MTNVEIGRRIVEHEQQGAERAGYGKEFLKTLSVRLTEEFGRGFSEGNLARMRKISTQADWSLPELKRQVRMRDLPHKPTSGFIKLTKEHPCSI